MKMYEYTIVRSSFFPGGTNGMAIAIANLEREVTKRLSAGWKCKGGVAVEASLGNLLQSMTRVTDIPPLQGAVAHTHSGDQLNG